MKFVGRTGLFTPVAEGQGGAVMYRLVDGKLFKVTGTSGHLWLESEVAETNEAKIDVLFFDKLRDDAIKAIEKYGDPEEFCGRKLR